MTPSPALVHAVLAASSKSTSSSAWVTLLPLLAIGVLGYFFFIRPQQRKAQAAKEQQKSGIEVGDEVQTVGGVIGTVLEIHGDRYTLLTGALGADGNLDGPQPTRIVFVRQAIARKIEPIEDIRLTGQPVDDDIRDEGPVDDVRDVRPSQARGSSSGEKDAGAVGGGTSAPDNGSADNGLANGGASKRRKRPRDIENMSTDFDDIGGSDFDDLGTQKKRAQGAEEA
jgi:preprotein translocase YajC subunit